jgi:ECF transporter S component (folate family)
MENKQRVTIRTQDLVLSSLLIAMVFVATYVLRFTLPISINGGLIHLGNVMLFMSAIVFGKKHGAIAGAFGMGLFDILSGWAIWAPFTFVIRGVMGFIIGYFAYSKGRNGKNILWNLIGILIASIWMIGGYYLTEVILYGNWLSPVTSIPGNIIQLVVGAVIGIPVSTLVLRIKEKSLN